MSALPVREAMPQSPRELHAMAVRMPSEWRPALLHAAGWRHVGGSMWLPTTAPRVWS